MQSGGGMAEGTSKLKQNDEPNPNEKLVRVFDTEQESEAMVVRGLLESQGIESELTAIDAPQDILPGVGGNIVVVRQEDAARAKELIEEYRQTPTDIETEDASDEAQ